MPRLSCAVAMTALLILMPLPADAVAQVPEGLVEFVKAAGTGYSNVLYRPTISFRLGGTVSQHLRLGGESISRTGTALGTPALPGW